MIWTHVPGEISVVVPVLLVVLRVAYILPLVRRVSANLVVPCEDKRLRKNVDYVCSSIFEEITRGRARDFEPEVEIEGILECVIRGDWESWQGDILIWTCKLDSLFLL